jgi:hypothetical protein
LFGLESSPFPTSVTNAFTDAASFSIAVAVSIIPLFFAYWVFPDGGEPFSAGGRI